MNQLKAGALLSYVNIFANIAVGLVYTPIMLRLLGQVEFGLYSLIGAMVGYMSILDLGLGNTIVRYTARNRAVGTLTREAELNWLFLAIYAVIGLVSGLVGAGLTLNLDLIFGDTLTAAELYRAKIMMGLLTVNLVLTFPLSIFGSIMQAHERFIWLRVANIARVLLTPCITLPLLFQGYGSVALVVVTTITNIACLLANVWYAFRWLNVRFCRGKYERAFLREVAAYSFLIFLNAVMDKAYWSSGQFVLGITHGPLEIAVYAVSMQFVGMYMTFSTAISGVLLPKATMLVANGASADELTQFMIKVGRLQYLVVGYILGMFLLIGRPFIILWAGEEYVSAYGIILLLMVSLLIALVQNCGISILLAKNLNRYRMTLYTIAAGLSFVASFPLADAFGGMGCALATSCALVVSTGFFMNRYYRKKIGIDTALFWRSLAKMSRGVSLLILLGLAGEVFDLIPHSWSGVASFVLVGSALYFAGSFLGDMNDYEKDFCRQAYQRLKTLGRANS